MTHTTVGSVEKENRGSQTAYIHQINITSLDAAGQENYSPNTELSLPEDSNLQVIPVGQDNTSVIYSWDTANDHLDVTMVSDAGNAGNNTAPGEVRLLVAGGGV